MDAAKSAMRASVGFTDVAKHAISGLVGAGVDDAEFI
jgi:hypothetical protein